MHNELSINTLMLFRLKTAKVSVLLDRLMSDTRSLLQASTMGRYLYAALVDLQKLCEQPLSPRDEHYIRTTLTSVVDSVNSSEAFYKLSLLIRRCICDIQKRHVVKNIPVACTTPAVDSMKAPTSVYQAVLKSRHLRLQATLSRLHIPQRLEVREKV